MKRNRMRRLLSLVAAFLAVAMVGTACGADDGGDGQGGGEGGSKELTIGYIAWDENIALAHLYKAVLEDDYGYTVKLQQLDVAPTYQAVAGGDVDLFQDAWLPVTHEDYWNQYKDEVEDLGVWYNQATLNLAVPSYVDADSMADLKANAGKFGGTITGIEPGAGETRIIQQNVIPQYELEGAMTLKNSSTVAMLAALESAINKKEPIVVALWHPHWAYSRYDLKDLEDPKKAMGEAEQIHQLGREGFSADFPELAEQIKSFKMTDEQLGALEDEINKAAEATEGGELDAARKWAADNKEFIDQAFGSLATQQQ